MPHKIRLLSAFVGCCVIGIVLSMTHALGAEKPTGLRFELSFPTGTRDQPVDGRVFVFITKKATPEPRLQFNKYYSEPFFGQDVDALKPEQAVVIDGRSEGYPLENLKDLPAGDYFVQGLLNIYTTFHRADGHVVKLHMDQWEGQDFSRSPGNLYSKPVQIHLDPAATEPVRLVLDQKIPPIEIPKDTAHVKRVRFQSPLLSKFWGHPIFIGATILLPKDYERDTHIAYPVNYAQDHFTLAAPGGFSEKLDPAAPEQEQKSGQDGFSKAWLSDDYPRMLFVKFQHPTPYYDDSYGIDSPNTGPYGKAITEELIPYIEKHFRAIPKPWARVVSGGSTGGWISLALQIFHPDYFGGAFSYSPDPVDFHYFQMLNIYEWDSAWYRKHDWRKTPIPSERQADGLVTGTMKEHLQCERAMGSRGRSGGDWDAWQAVYGPLGKDGYFQPLIDPSTGRIDPEVAAYWKEHSDLNAYLQRHWPEIGAKLAGKIHIWVGDMDSFYLNNAVCRLEDFLKTTNPPWGGSITYGPRQPHCWCGPLTVPERLKLIAQHISANAPRDADRSWWRK